MLSLSNNLCKRSNVLLQGKAVKHQTDVYWELRFADCDYRTVIECKDWNTAVTLEKIMAFKGKLIDLNDPVGVFVSRKGFQSGAIKYAETYGIFLYQLFEEPKPEPIQVKEGSFAEFKIRPEDWVMENTYYEVSNENNAFTIDQNWFQTIKQELGQNIRKQLENVQLPPVPLSQRTLYNEEKEECGNLLKIFTPFAEKLFSERKSGCERCVHKFTIPTFLKTHFENVPFIKIESVTSDVIVTKHPMIERPMRLQGFVAFVLNKISDNAPQRFLLKQPDLDDGKIKLASLSKLKKKHNEPDQ